MRKREIEAIAFEIRRMSHLYNDRIEDNDADGKSRVSAWLAGVITILEALDLEYDIDFDKTNRITGFKIPAYGINHNI